MVERYAPLLRKCRFRAASDGDDGRGIRMGMGAGGAAIRMDVGCIVLPFTVPKVADEGHPREPPRPALHQRGRLPDGGRRGGAAARGRRGVPRHRQRDLRAARSRRPRSRRWRRPSPTSSARSACPTGNLQRTVAVYNEHAARGEDPLFRKAADYLTPLVHPPFAALDYRTRTRCTRCSRSAACTRCRRARC